MTKSAYTTADSRWSEDIPDCWWACPYDQEPGTKTRPNDFVRRIYRQRSGPLDWRTYCLTYHNRRYILDVVEWDPNSQSEREQAERWAAFEPQLRPGIGTKWPLTATPPLILAAYNQGMQTKLAVWELCIAQIVGHLTADLPPTATWRQRWLRLGESPSRIEHQLLPALSQRRPHPSKSMSHGADAVHVVEPSLTRAGLWEAMWEARLVWPDGRRLSFVGPDRAEVAKELDSAVQALDADLTATRAR